MTAKEIIAVFEQAAQANRMDRCREGNIIHLQGPGEVIMTGDLHGHHRNFDKLVRLARLAENPQRHLILHELIHGDTSGTPGQCHSYLLVARAAELKIRFPHQVHYLLGNHAMAQVTNDEVLKGGEAMVRALNAALDATFNDNTEYVSRALNQFFLSLPIAARTDNKIWMSHSLPASRHLEEFKEDIFEKKITTEDMRIDPSLRALIWDRSHNENCLETLCEKWDIDVFIVGHQPQANGWGRPHRQMIILACDHNHGCYLPYELQKPYHPDELADLVSPLARIE